MATYSYRLRSSAATDVVAGVTFYAATNVNYATDQAALNAWVPTLLDRYVDGVLDNNNKISLEDEAVSFNERAKHIVEHTALSTSKISNITVTGTLASGVHTVFIDATASSIVLALPLASIPTPTIRLKRTDSSVNTVTINRSGTDTIDGETSISLAPKDAVDLETNGISLWSIF